MDDLVAAARRSPGLPSWWKLGVHDRPFLEGLAKHGINRQDLIVGDEDLPFAKISQTLTILRQEFREKKAAEDAAAAERGEMEIDQPSITANGDMKPELTIDSIKEQKEQTPVITSEAMDGVVAEQNPETAVSEDQPKVESSSAEIVMGGLEDDASKLNGDVTLPLADHMAPDTNVDQVNGSAMEITHNTLKEEAPAADVGNTALLKTENDDGSPSTKDLTEQTPETKAEEGSSALPAPKVPAAPAEPEEFVWPKEAVVLRRMDHLIDIVLNPKPATKKKLLRNQAAQLALNNSLAASKNKKGVDEVDYSDSDRTEDDREHPMTASSVPASPASQSKKRSRTSTKESKQLVTIEGEGDSTPGVKKTGLKLTIKLGKMPSKKETKKEVKKEPKEKKKRKQPAAVQEPEPMEDIGGSSGSDTDEMMALASKQVEYLQRKILERKKSKSGKPSSSSKASPKPYSAPSSSSHQRKPSTASLKRHRRHRSSSSGTGSSSSGSSSSSSGSSSSGSSSGSNSDSDSSRSRSRSPSYSDSDSDSDARRRRRDRKSKHKKSRPSSLSSMRKRDRTPDRHRERERERDRDRSRDRDRERERERERDRQRRDRDRVNSSSSSSKARQRHQTYNGGMESYHGDASASASPMSIVSRNVTGLKLSSASSTPHYKRKVSTPRSDEGSSYPSSEVMSQGGGYDQAYHPQPSSHHQGHEDGDDHRDEDDYDEEDEDEEEAYRKRAKA